MTDATPTASTSTTATDGFLEKLRRRWHDGRTLLCVGLDPELDQLPTAQGTDTETALVTFNMAIVDATADLVCAYKPNVAFYERHGAAGWNALARTIAYIHSRYPGVPVLVSERGNPMQPIGLALKSGNFGSPDFFAKALDRIAGHE